MKTGLAMALLRKLLPVVLGAIGGVAMTLFPAYHLAFCNGVI